MNIYPLSYDINLINHYHAFCELNGFVLLESSDTTHGRYDILTALPYDRIVVERDSLLLQNVKKRLQAEMTPKVSRCDLPFQGGAIGYIAYDFGAAMMGIDSLPHPLWSDLPLVDLGLYDWAIITDHLLKKVHLLVKNERARKEMYERWFDHQCVSKPFILQESFRPIVSKNEYQQSYQNIKSALSLGRAYQVNLTQPFLAEYTGDVWGMYEQVRIKNPVPYAAFLKLNSAEIISFSPERFLTIDDQKVQTSPIKGTAKRSCDPVIDDALRQTLMDCPKNRAENIMIVDLLRNDLSQFSKPGSVRVTSLCDVQSYHKVHHLVSHIEAQCQDNITPIDAFLACFPGGSITGAPKLEAMRIIHEEEPFSRGIYCGSIAYFSRHGRVDSNIAIRTITAKNNQLYLPAGGGIVMDSVCDDEYEECLTKIAAFIA